jgi:hypothetical protein
VLDGSHVTTSKTHLAAAADTLAVVVRQLGLDTDAAHHALDEPLRRI